MSDKLVFGASVSVLIASVLVLIASLNGCATVNQNANCDQYSDAAVRQKCIDDQARESRIERMMNRGRP